jgi:hypothetical protein
MKARRGWQRLAAPVRADNAARRSVARHAPRRGELHHCASKKEAALPEWQAAIEALMLVVERDGPTMLARIGVMRALNRGRVRVFNPDRKDPHWGRRKLKREEWRLDFLGSQTSFSGSPSL